MFAVVAVSVVVDDAVDADILGSVVASVLTAVVDEGTLWFADVVSIGVSPLSASFAVDDEEVVVVVHDTTVAVVVEDSAVSVTGADEELSFSDLASCLASLAAAAWACAVVSCLAFFAASRSCLRLCFTTSGIHASIRERGSRK